MTSTARISGAAAQSLTQRVATSTDSLENNFDPWGGSWGDAWGDSWRVVLSVTQLGGTQRVSQAPAASTAQRVAAAAAVNTTQRVATSPASSITPRITGPVP